ncbi:MULTISPECIES: bacitracin resistance protein [unclassified Microbacterium]|uniref:bacitracin resistance protein n=1 Tax=unclassified Microbacterium TaxID=2609290 RepID=UPI00089284E3|nr:MULTISPECIES: bacitracin resistance protein [unclassified Microbacterium]AOX47074.1 bacitracin resistance protein [Microbacterium sp. BH-3-3-3]MBD8218467.1 bacitracin resistance protein [Microbacterium sp. CFBP 13617]
MSAPARPRHLPTGLVVTIAGLFGLFYAYVVWSAVALLILQATGPLGLNGLGWVVYILPIVFPLLAFGAAFAIGQRRKAGEFAIVLLAGLTLSAAFWLAIVGYGTTSYGLYGG